MRVLICMHPWVGLISPWIFIRASGRHHVCARRWFSQPEALLSPHSFTDTWADRRLRSSLVCGVRGKREGGGDQDGACAGYPERRSVFLRLEELSHILIACPTFVTSSPPQSNETARCWVSSGGEKAYVNE